MWLAEALLRSRRDRTHANVTILGGWFGVLAAVLLHDPRFSIGKVTSIDIDPRCAAIRVGGERDAHARAGKFEARTAGMLDLDYGPAIARRGRRPRRRPRHQYELRASRGLRPLVRAGPPRATARPPVERLFRLRPARQLRCPTSPAFRAQAPMREVLFRGRSANEALYALHADRAEMTWRRTPM